MKYWAVYKRAGRYRVARPGWFLWHWHCRWNPYDAYFPFETPSREEAEHERDELNAQVTQKARFARARWEIA